MTLKGREIDLFWHPTAVRPGSILEIGNHVSFAGYFGPTLPCSLSLTLTSPSGKVRNLGGQANKIGYFYNPDLDFFADEAGSWTVRVSASYDGFTSAGQVQPPFPMGDVLGTVDGEFHFYVVERDSDPLEVELPAESFVRPAERAIAIEATAPQGLSKRQLDLTTTMPGFLLEDLSSASFIYHYDATALAEDFPNLDLFDADGKAGADLITMSLLASGKDSTGHKQFRARQVTLQGEELFNPPQAPSAPCANTDQSLCLNAGRFLVKATWKTLGGQSGPAHAVQLTGDSGYFWFFRPDNIELLLKVLNACVAPFDRFWVFSAGLTNVEVRLEVTDTATGEVRFYDNPQDTAYAPIQDTRAFSTCGAPAPAVGATVTPLAATSGGGSSDRGALSGACTPTPTSLCLSGDRFRVEAEWLTHQGPEGHGQAVSLSADTGYFWFFRPDNVEIIVKVLNACGAPFDRFWVFAGGLTNVEVRLRVTDTETGVVREYTNPLDRAFQPIQDTGAFASCP